MLMIVDYLNLIHFEKSSFVLTWIYFKSRTYGLNNGYSRISSVRVELVVEFDTNTYELIK